MSTPLRVLLVGAGWAAQRHHDAIRDRGDRVSAVAGPDAGQCAELASAAGGASCHATLEAWLASGEQVDAAVISSPSSEHLAQTTLLVERGIPVLVEKPHRLPGESGGALLDAIERTGTPVQVGMTTRFGSGMAALRELIAGERLGRLLWISDRIWRQPDPDFAPWYFDRRRSGGGVLVTNGVHALDRVAWLLGEPLELLGAELATLVPGREVEDAASLRLTTASNVNVEVSLLWAPYPVAPDALRVVGTRGSAEVHPDGSWHVSDADGERSVPAEQELLPFQRQWAAFAEVVAGDKPPEPGVATVERALETIEAAYELAGARA